MTNQTLPAEAVEAAAKAIHRYDVREGLASTYAPNEHHRAEARLAIEAAAPYMLSHEADELAAEYRRGYRDGLVDRKQVTASPREWEPGDPVE